MSTPPTLEHSGFFVMRTPLLAFGDFVRWGAASADGPREASARRAELRKKLAEFVARPDVSEAIFLAAASLHERLADWLEEPESERGRRLEGALVRYFSRMTSRPTPFGLFAGLSLGEIGGARSELVHARAHSRHVRLDMGYLHALAAALAGDPRARSRAPLWLNTSAYRLGDRLRYIGGRRRDGSRCDMILSTAWTDALEQVIARIEEAATRGGPGPTRDGLANALVLWDPEIARDDAVAYVDGLVENDILISSAFPPLTCEDALGHLVTFASDVGIPEVASVLETVRTELARMSDAPLGLPASRYRAVAASLESLPAAVDASRLFQVDMKNLASPLVLDEALVREITDAVTLLARVSAPSPSSALAAFKREFLRAYEGREVPLCEALDEEAGIGFLVPSETADVDLLRGLALTTSEPSTVSWNARERYLLARLSRCLSAGEDELTLNDDDLAALESPGRPGLPDALYANVSLAVRSAEELAHGGGRIVMSGAMGPSGAIPFGRFCHGDPDLRARVGRHLRAEERLRPEAIYAEIVHLPDDRGGNVIARPPLRDHEIPYDGRASVARGNQLAISDLLISVRNDRIVLRSARLGREVLPRLSSAHNYDGHGLRPIYRFLASLQTQDLNGVYAWSWGPFLDAPRLPRVVCGRIVLARATFTLSEPQCRQLAGAHEDDREEAIARLRSALRMPRFVAFCEGDNELAVDWDNELSADACIQLLRGRSTAYFREIYPSPEDAGPETSSFPVRHELFIPFTVRRPSRSGVAAIAAPRPSGSPVPRVFAPGSEWLYAKLYVRPGTSDRVLRELVLPTVEAAKALDARRWFFLRYADPDPHLRLRIHGSPETLWSKVLPFLHEASQSLLATGALRTLTLATYERETERYGGVACIEAVEETFCADSRAVIEILSGSEPHLLADARWRLALLGVDALLGDWGLADAEKEAVVAAARRSYARAVPKDARLERQIGAKFRAERAAIEPLLDGRSRDVPSESTVRAAFTGRRATIAPIVSRWSAPLRAELAASAVHMHVNRMLRSAQNAQEMVIYEFLSRIYEGRRARQRRGAA